MASVSEDSNSSSSNTNNNNNKLSANDDSYEEDFEKDTDSQIGAMASVSEDGNSSSSNTNNNNNKLAAIDDSYEEDFEKDTDSQSEDTSKSGNNGSKELQVIKDEDEVITEPLRASSPTQEAEKGQSEEKGSDKPDRERVLEDASDNESDPEGDAYSFTEDQKRAMMELIVQKQEDGDYLDEEPPEYNVKERLTQLNEELANDPTPVEGDREHRVGFKAEIVDLVAPPPPEFSDDESQPNSARGEPQKNSEASSDSKESDGAKDGPKNKQFVVERDGNFEVVAASELTASERAMYMDKDDEEEQEKKNAGQKSGSSDSNRNNNNTSSSQVVPKPPARPRPNTASTGMSRRQVRPAQSPRPKSASHMSSSNSSLDNFYYNSPYAMTPEQKEQAREIAQKMEEERKERERRKKEEDEEKRKDNEAAFGAWLQQKRESRSRQEDDKEQQAQMEKQRLEQEEKRYPTLLVTTSQAGGFDSYDVIYPYLLLKDPMEKNEEAYKLWLKKKRSDGKKDKLLKRRQQQEMTEGYFLRPREDCERAYKEWLRQKNYDIRKQQALEKQKNHMYRVQLKKARKSQALVKALKESQSFRYVDYYGYRF